MRVWFTLSYLHFQLTITHCYEKWVTACNVHDRNILHRSLSQHGFTGFGGGAWGVGGVTG